MGDISKGVANTHLPAKKYTKENQADKAHQLLILFGHIQYSGDTVSESGLRSKLEPTTAIFSFSKQKLSIFFKF
jgi:hypothetical protein